MNSAWYARRLARMSPGEMAARFRTEVAQRRLRRERVVDAAADALPVPGSVPAFAVLLPASARVVPPEARASLLAAADQLLAGRWRIFDRQRDDMAPVPDWFADPRSGRTAPAEVYCFDLDHRREDLVGNVKYVWELSRHHHCTVLAAAYWLSGDERYADAVSRHLASWWAANPYLSGINWTSGIELGIRLISWVWVRRLLASWPDVGAVFEDNATFLRQLDHHHRYLAMFPSRGSSANNHLVAEAAGQFVAGCAFPWLPESDRWRAAAADVLVREIPRQTFATGVNRELAGGYHLFALELSLAAALEGEAAGYPLDPVVWDVIERMVDALAALVDVRLRPPRQGDSDDGHGLLVDAPDAPPAVSLLATGHALFGRRPWWPPTPPEDVRTRLWSTLARPPRRVAPRPDARPSLFADAGIVVLRDKPGGDDELWCRGDHGPQGYLSIAAHGHADALSLELRCGGVDILAEPGTYCYHGEPSWRSYFRSTAAHNTLELAGADQSVSGGPFLWTRQARSWLEHLGGLDGCAVTEWQAAHDGYTRLEPPAVHHRALRLDRAARSVTIRDWIDCDGSHPCRLAFHLGPAVSCSLEGTKAQLRWDAPGTRWATMALPEHLRWECIRGREDPPCGWYSPSFDVRVPSITLVGLGALGGKEELVSTLRFGSGTDQNRGASRP